MNYEVNSVKKEFLDAFRGLYEASFPADERRDFEDVEKLLCAKDSNFHVFTFSEEGAFAGFVSFWEWDDMRYFEHFAVEPELRNGGRGAAYLRHVVALADTPVVLEVEPPECEMSKRRVAFYERNGFRLWSELDYMQPSYGPGRNPMPLKLMTCGSICFTGSDDERILRIKREVYGCW